MYLTSHLHEGPIGDTNPAVAFRDKIYSFGWPQVAERPDVPEPMQVHFLNTENLAWTKVTTNPGQEESAIEPQQRFGHSAVAYGDKIYIWGGAFQERFFDELLCFRPSSSTWSMPDVSGNIPQARLAHYAFAIGHNMYLLGGYEKRTKKYSPDVFALDLRTMEWKYIAAHSGPYMWEGISACAVGHRIYIFGGELYRSHWNGGSFLDTETGKWHRIVICESCPLTWKSPAFVYDNSIFVFGGVSNLSTWDGIFLYKLSSETNRWENVHICGMSPIPLVYHSCVVVHSRVFVFGGKCRPSVDDGDPVDLHIIDFKPSLHLLCIRAVLQYDLRTESLPTAIKAGIYNVCTLSRRMNSLIKLTETHDDFSNTSADQSQ